MAEDNYRVQRKPIESSEVSETPEVSEAVETNEAANKAMMDRIAQVQQQAKGESGGESALNAPLSEPGLDVKGMENAPPQFQQALGRQVSQGNQSAMQMKQRSQQSMPDLRATGSTKLEELLQGIYSTGNVYEEITLPSLGKFYNGSDGPVDGKLHVRRMTGEEEQILATPRFVRKGEAVNMIFERCMQENYDAQEFLTEDRTYLLIYLRGISYSPNYDVELKCPETDQVFAETIDLNSLYVDNCPVDFNPEDLKGVLPDTGYKFSYRLSKGKDETAVQNHRERMIKNFDRSNEADDTLLFRTSLLVNEIEGLDDDLELMTLLRRLPIRDVAYLRNLLNDPPFGVDTQLVITSPYTMQEFTVDLPLEANFFFPRQRKESRQTNQA